MCWIFLLLQSEPSRAFLRSMALEKTRRGCYGFERFQVHSVRLSAKSIVPTMITFRSFIFLNFS